MQIALRSMSVSAAAVMALATAFPILSPAAAGEFFITSDAEYDALNQASPFTQVGRATLQWGNSGTVATNTNWQYAIQNGSSTTALQFGATPWDSLTNVLQPSSGALFTYSYLGKLGINYTFRGVKYAKSATVTPTSTLSSINTLWLRAILPQGGRVGTVVLAGLTLILADKTVVEINELYADSDGEYFGFTDPRLKNGFSIKYGFGYFHDTLGLNDGALPSFQLRVGSSALTGTVPAATTVDFFDDGIGDGEIGADYDTGSRQFADEFDTQQPGSVPEPASWAMMISGFALIGAALRRRRAYA
jgi:hypothetical protein